MKTKKRYNKKKEEYKYVSKILLITGFCILLLSYFFSGFFEIEGLALIAVAFGYSLLYIGLFLFPENSLHQSWSYLKTCRIFVIAIALVFIVLMVFAFLFSSFFSFLDIFLQELIKKTEGLSAGGLIEFILLNNARSAFFGIFLGIALGVFPVLHAIANGSILGYVFARVYQVSGFADFWRILPHGIFELPAIFIALGLGLKLGMFIFDKQPSKELYTRFFNSLKVFLVIVVPLLIIAALIEGFLIALLG